MSPPTKSRLGRVAMAVLAGAVALTMTACAESQRGDDSQSGDQAKVGGTMTF